MPILSQLKTFYIFLNNLEIYDHLGDSNDKNFIFGRLEDVRVSKAWAKEVADRKKRENECEVCLRKFTTVGIKTHMTLHRKQRYLYPEDVSDEDFFAGERDYAEMCGKWTTLVASSSIHRDVSMRISPHAHACEKRILMVLFLDT